MAGETAYKIEAELSKDGETIAREMIVMALDYERAKEWAEQEFENEYPGIEGWVLLRLE